MPRPKPLPDLADVDLAELQIAILTVFDAHHVGPEFRRIMHGEFGDLLERCGGAREVLQAALAAIRRSISQSSIARPMVVSTGYRHWPPRWSQIQMFAKRLDRRGCCHLASGKLKEAVRKAAQLDQRTLSSLIERLLTEHCQKVGTLKRRPIRRTTKMTMRLTVHDGELKRYAVSVRCTSQQNIIWTSKVLVFATNTEDAKTAAIEKMIDKYLRHQSKRTTWITVGEPEEC